MAILTKCVCVLFVIALSFGEEQKQSDFLHTGKSLLLPDEFTLNQQQNWRAVDYFSPSSDLSGWIPQNGEEEEVTPPPKRRRIRKRKRRPPMISMEDEDNPTTTTKKAPIPWEEMMDEPSQKPYIRRRLSPVYEETVVVRDPFTGLREAEENQRPSADLKTLLKQSGGMSLSEILQQKNLSLAELLMGSKQALSALVEPTTAEPSSPTTAAYKRLPPSVGLRKDLYVNEEKTESSLTSEEIMEAQRKRLSLLHGSHSDSKLFGDVTNKFDVVTEETTERRIFVPSNVQQQDQSEIATSTTPPPEITTGFVDVAAVRSRPPLPLTSAKLNKQVTNSTQDKLLPPKAVPIGINEIFGLKENKTQDKPFRMTINLMQEQIEDDSTTTTEIRLEENLISSTKRADFDIKTTTPLGEKVKEIKAKDEIMEVLKNPSDRAQLARILRSRNMTVEQLVEQRERGSSQLHLADIFHNKTREPDPKDQPFVVGQINPPEEFFNNFPLFKRRPKTRPAIKESVIDSVTRPQEYTITSFPTFKIELNKNTIRQQQFDHHQSSSAFPVGSWRELYPHFFTHKLPAETSSTISLTTNQPPSSSTLKIIYEDLLTIRNVQSNSDEEELFNNKLDSQVRPIIYDDADEETGEFMSLPSGVKSAIVASMAIVGLSLIVFITILVIFKWSQRQKRKLNYAGSSFSGSRIIKSPILDGIQKRSIKTFVSETLGRKKSNPYYRAHMQSMSDSIWDSSEKKSYMI